MNFLLANANHIPGILHLQELNLYNRLTEVERKLGFVTTPFSEALVQESIEKEGLFVAVDDKGMVKGYAFAGTWAFFERWPIFPYMETLLGTWKLDDQGFTRENSFQYGPVCVDVSERGKGVFPQLFEAMRLHWKNKFPYSITFINAINEVSSKAHAKIGWGKLGTFSYNDQGYLALAYDMERFTAR